MAQAATLTLAMAAFQASIGAVNDLRDLDDDAVGQPWKPIPSGRVTRRTAGWVAAIGLTVGVVGSLALGVGVLFVGLAGYGVGVSYDLRLKRTAWGWLGFAVGLSLVPVYAWLGAGAGLPPDLGMLLVLGGLAGLELALANALVDAPADGRIGARGLAVRLGPRRARRLMAAAAVGVVGLAWLSMLGVGTTGEPRSSALAVTGLVLGTTLLATGVAMSARDDAAWSWRGWPVQACGVAVMAVIWFASS
jgi:4-hydroxybenzoate polyprenyltransferase